MAFINRARSRWPACSSAEVIAADGDGDGDDPGEPSFAPLDCWRCVQEIPRRITKARLDALPLRVVPIDGKGGAAVERRAPARFLESGPVQPERGAQENSHLAACYRRVWTVVAAAAASSYARVDEGLNEAMLRVSDRHIRERCETRRW